MASNPKRQAIRKIMVDLGIMTVIGIFLALIGPFGSIEQPLPVRLISWLGFAYIGYAIYSPMGALVDRLARGLDLPRPPLWLFAVAIATIPMTAAVWSFGFIPDPVPMPSLEQAFTSYFYVFVVGGAVTMLFYFLESRKSVAAPVSATGSNAAPKPETAPETAPVAPAPETKVASCPFLDRLPPALGSDLLALEMEDHYVRAHTALGDDLVLMRLRDAMVELEGVEGLQTHRSWWVARSAVDDVKREGRNVKLVLAGGLEAPVSRANVSALKKAGWI